MVKEQLKEHTMSKHVNYPRSEVCMTDKYNFLKINTQIILFPEQISEMRMAKPSTNFIHPWKFVQNFAAHKFWFKTSA